MFTNTNSDSVSLPLDQSFSTIKQQLDTLKDDRLSCDLEIKDKEGQLTNLKKTHSSLNASFSKLKLDNDRLKNELELKQNFMKETNERLEILMNAVQVANKFLNDMESRIASYEVTKKLYLQENEKKEAHLKALEDQFSEKLMVKTKQIESEVEKAKLEASKHEEDLSNFEIETTKIKNKSTDLIAELKSKNLNINEMCVEILKNTDIIQELKNDLCKSEEGSADLTTKLTDESNKLALLTEKNNLLQVSEKNLEVELENFKKKHLEASEQIDSLKVVVSERDQEIVTLKTTFEQTSIDTLAKHMIELTFQSNVFTDKLEKQSAEFEAKSLVATTTIHNLETNLETVRKSDSDMQDLYRKSQVELKNSEDKCRDLKSELAERIERTAELVTKFEADTKLALDKMNEQNENISAMQFENRYQQTQWKELNEKNNEANERVLELNETILNLNGKVETVSGKKKELYDELKKQATEKDRCIDNLRNQYQDSQMEQTELNSTIIHLKDKMERSDEKHQRNLQSAIMRKNVEISECTLQLKSQEELEYEIEDLKKQLDAKSDRLSQTINEMNNLKTTIIKGKTNKKTSSTQTIAKLDSVNVIENPVQMISDNLKAREPKRFKLAAASDQQEQVESNSRLTDIRNRQKESDTPKQSNVVNKQFVEPKNPYSIRIVQKENSVTSEEKILEFNDSFLANIDSVKSAGGLAFKRSKRKQRVVTSTPVREPQTTSQMDKIQLSAVPHNNN